MSKPKLISFKVCPFVQRSVILLKEKNVDYDIEFIDVYNPPEWFLKLSPTGKVPILVVDDTVIFESAVIGEYLEEVYSPALHPSNPVTKAQNRAWMEYTSPLYMGFFGVIMAQDQDAVDVASEEMDKNLAGLANAKTHNPWFNGDDFSMVDIAVAPFFVRAAFAKKHVGIDFLAKHADLQAWSEQVLARQSVIDSTVEGFDEMMLKMMKAKNSFLLNSFS
ncbi:MAG: glutathione S-transferase family protein [Cocleimonas sp.]|nr:glutathione S-transferase family protein [Cocleimonas sp.]